MFITSILKPLVIFAIRLALCSAIYSQIALSCVRNRLFFSANEKATLKTKQPTRFQGLITVTNRIVGKWKLWKGSCKFFGTKWMSSISYSFLIKKMRYLYGLKSCIWVIKFCHLKMGVDTRQHYCRVYHNRYNFFKCDLRLWSLFFTNNSA